MKISHQSDDLKSSHVTPAAGNVFADLGFSAQEAKGLLEDADVRIAKTEKLKEEADKIKEEIINNQDTNTKQ